MNKVQVNPDLDNVELLKKVFTESRSLLEAEIIYEKSGSGWYNKEYQDINIKT